VLVPAVVFAAGYVLQQQTAIGYGYLVYFVGFPLWVVLLAASMWTATRLRVKTAELPPIFSWGLGLLVLADWQFFLWFFKPFQAPFVSSAVVAGCYLVTARSIEPSNENLTIKNGAFAHKLFQSLFKCIVGLAAIRLAAFALSFITLVPFTTTYLVQAYAGLFAWWGAVGLAALLGYILYLQAGPRTA
jgi:hypothetical protein